MDNLEILDTITKEEYPAMFDELHKYGRAMLRRLMQLIEYFYSVRKEKHTATDNKGREWFFVSIDYLIFLYGGSAETWNEYTKYWAAIGLLFIIKPTEKSVWWPFKISVRQAANNHRRAVLHYHIPDYIPDVLEAAENKIKQFRAAGINRKGLSKDSIIEAMGQDAANRIFVDGRKKSRRGRNAEKWIKQEIIKQIELKGYALKDKALYAGARKIMRLCEMDLMEALCYVRRVWKNRSKYILDRIGCTHHRPTAAEKKLYHLCSNGWIITRKSN